MPLSCFVFVKGLGATHIFDSYCSAQSKLDFPIRRNQQGRKKAASCALFVGAISAMVMLV